MIHKFIIEAYKLAATMKTTAIHVNETGVIKEQFVGQLNCKKSAI